MANYLCVIPARGGSKGLPGKNLRDLGGKPLVAWSIEHALKTPAVDRVLVSTDNEDIAQVARTWGADVPFLRPDHLATDEAPTEPSLLHALEALEAGEGYRPDAVILLQPTSPVRTPDALARAIARFEATGADSLVSVHEIHPFLWRRPDDPTPTYDPTRRPRRQDIPADERLYEENGSIYITRTAVLQAEGNRIGGQVVLFVMDPSERHDIDTPTDLAIAEAALTLLEVNP